VTAVVTGLAAVSYLLSRMILRHKPQQEKPS
jgi:hypothetical protein